MGDNIYYGQSFGKQLEAASNREHGATVFGYHVTDPERFGVVEFDPTGKFSALKKTIKAKITLCRDGFVLL